MDPGEYMKIILVCMFSFGPSLFFAPNEFVYDDGIAIMQNDDVINTNRSILSSAYNIILHDFWGQDVADHRSHKSYRPVVTLMFHLEYRYFNATNLPAIMKRINLLVHIVTCCVIYNLLRHVFDECHQSVISMAVLLFAAHPIHTEVICSVVGRSDLLCALFFFITIREYLKAIEDHENTGEFTWKTFVLVFDVGVLALFSKEVGIMAVPLCIVYDVLTNAKLPKVRKRDVGRRFEFLRKSCGNVMLRSVCAIGLTFVLAFLRHFCSRYTFPTFTPMENPIAAHPNFLVRLLSSLYVHTLHMWLLICPDWLCCDWSHHSFDLIETLFDQRNIYAILLYCSLIYAFNVGPRPLRIAIAFLVIPFIPSSHLITVGFVVADRVLYIPSLGYCVLISIGLSSFLPKYPNIVQSIYVMLLVLFMLRSNERSIDWQNNINLFTSAIRVCPTNAKIYYNLGQMYAMKGDYNHSLAYNLKAVELSPNNIGALVNLGNAYRNLGDPEKALHYHKQVIGINPNYTLGWMNLGISYVKNGFLDDALDAYLKADKLKPNDGKITFNLGNLYLRIGKLPLAEEMYRKSVELDPRSHASHINLIVFLSEHGTVDELMSAIDNANFHLYENVPVLMSIAQALSKVNFDFERIERLYNRILELEPKNVKAHGQLAVQYQRRNKPKLALKHFKRAREIYPNFEVNDDNFNNFLQRYNIIAKPSNTTPSPSPSPFVNKSKKDKKKMTSAY